MAISFQKLDLEQSATFKSAVQKLYHSTPDTQSQRYADLYQYHVKKHDGEVRFFSSPGRIEICGNHTDHNKGKVLCASVTIDTLGAVTKRDDGIVTIDSIGFPLVEVDGSDLTPKKSEYGTSEGLVRGVLAGFKKRGYNIGGFDATTVTNVFKGAGVSSSAAFEVLVAEILNVLYNDAKLEKMEKAIIAQYAENVFFGKPSGLMDQSAIALGGVSYIDFKNLKNPKVESVKWQFDDVDVVIVNCGGDHCNLTPNYAAIRKEMEEVASFFGKKVLRQVDEKVFYQNIAELKKNFSERAILRAMHFYDENKRVKDAKKAIEKVKENKAFAIINASGESSYKMLQNCYPEGSTEQPIPLALTLTQKQKGVRACRVHGGGFAGTILIMIDKEYTKEYVQSMEKLYGKENVFVLGIRDDGAVEVQL